MPIRFLRICTNIGVALCVLRLPCALASPQEKPASNPDEPYQVKVTPSDTVTVHWKSGALVPLSPEEKTARDDALFISRVLEVLEDAIITKLQARVSLEEVKVEKGRVRLIGVLLREADIGLRIKNDGARKLAGAIHDRYGLDPDAPSWTRVMHLAKMGVFNDLEISLQLEQLYLRQILLDADALQVKGLLLDAAAGPNEKTQDKASDNKSTSPVGATARGDTTRGDATQSLFKILERASITRAEAHLRLEHLKARRLRLELDSAALQNLRILVALRRADDAPRSRVASPPRVTHPSQSPVK